MNKILTYLSVAVIICGAITWGIAHDQSLARATDILVIRAQIQAIHSQLDLDQKLRRARDIDQRIWDLEQRYENKTMPLAVKEEMHRLRVELSELRG